MKLQTKIRFAIDMLIESPVNFFISVLLSGIGFGLFGFTLFVYLAGNNGINSAERVLSNGVKQTGIIDLDEFYDDKGKEFRKQVYSSEIIDCIGAFSYSGFDVEVFHELYDIQYRNEINQSQQMPNNNLQMLVVDKELLSLCEIGFDEDRLQEYMNETNENIQYLYLGNAYKEIPVGTEFIDSSQKPSIIYKVAGILKEDTCFASKDLMFGVDFTTLRSDVNMNYEIILINNEASVFSPWMFSVNKKYSFEEGKNELKRIANLNEIKIKAYSLQSVFDKAQIETEIMQDSLLEMLILIIIVISVIVISLQIVEIFHRSHIYGIMYSVGFLSSEINVIMIIRNIIYFIFSICVGLLILLAIGKKYFITNIQVNDMFFELLLQQVLPSGLILMLILFSVITIIPSVIFCRLDPVELIYNN